jgi:hypothetical protein
VPRRSWTHKELKGLPRGCAPLGLGHYLGSILAGASADPRRRSRRAAFRYTAGRAEREFPVKGCEQVGQPGGDIKLSKGTPCCAGSNENSRLRHVNKEATCQLPNPPGKRLENHPTATAIRKTEGSVERVSVGCWRTHPTGSRQAPIRACRVVADRAPGPGAQGSEVSTRWLVPKSGGEVVQISGKGFVWMHTPGPTRRPSNGEAH